MKTLKILIVSLFAAGTAHAATLSDIKGDVRVSHGEGFVAVKGSTEVAPGDKIKVGQKAGVKLVYSDGCSLNVPAGALATVAKQSPCSYRAQLINQGQNPYEVCLPDSFDPRCCFPDDNNPNHQFSLPACGVILTGLGVFAGIPAALATSSNSRSIFIPPVVNPPAAATTTGQSSAQ
jgi:hypothetical protein